jgi:7-carboxy-7-deazaguanine synthase
MYLHAVDTIEICETFTSIQGESSFVGRPCFFIRCSGCNLDCNYCDTELAHETGYSRNIGDLVAEARASKASIIEITGGEPLMQEGFQKLATGLRDGAGKPVLVETNGSYDISIVPQGVTAIVDVKCPGSGEEGSFNEANLEKLGDDVELKFVLSGRADFEWARDYVKTKELEGKCREIHFSPVSGKLDTSELVGWVLEEGLNVRVGVQWHKLTGVR